jgi:CMP-2-keto-3-deoxyoctulosonic acid synthetase
LRALRAPPCELEDIEKLEQCALYLGLRIRVGRAETLPEPGVDTEADCSASRGCSRGRW